MNFKSILEFLVEEKQLCSKLQDVDNVLAGVEQAIADGSTNKENRWEIVRQLTEVRAEACAELYTVRLALGARLMELEDITGRAIAEKLHRATAEGKDG